MNIKQNLVSKDKYGIKCPYALKPTYITIHNTANDAPAANEIKYMISNNKETSFHIAVDDKEAIQGIPFNRNAWHAGDGGSGVGNRQSIAVEICYSKSGGAKFDKAYANALEVVAQLMKEFNIPASNIKYHKNWSGKNCPHRLIAMGVTVEKFRALAQQKYNDLYIKNEADKKDVTYQVVAGSFKNKPNAETRANHLRSKGFDCFIQVK